MAEYISALAVNRECGRDDPSGRALLRGWEREDEYFEESAVEQHARRGCGGERDREGGE